MNACDHLRERWPMTTPGILGAGALVSAFSAAVTQAAVSSTAGPSVALPVALIVGGVTGVLAIGGMFATVRIHKQWTDRDIGRIEKNLDKSVEDVREDMRAGYSRLEKNMSELHTMHREELRDMSATLGHIRETITQTVAARRKTDYPERGGPR